MVVANKNKSYRFDNHTCFSCQYHIIFCPKYRRKVLTDKIAPRLREILIECARLNNSSILEMEILSDHVHLLVETTPKIGIEKLIKRMKGRSSNFLRREFPELKKRLPCLWSRNKFISTVGEVSLETVKKYIEEQKGK